MIIEYLIYPLLIMLIAYGGFYLVVKGIMKKENNIKKRGRQKH